MASVLDTFPVLTSPRRTFVRSTGPLSTRTRRWEGRMAMQLVLEVVLLLRKAAREGRVEVAVVAAAAEDDCDDRMNGLMDRLYICKGERSMREADIKRDQKYQRRDGWTPVRACVCVCAFSVLLFCLVEAAGIYPSFPSAHT